MSSNEDTPVENDAVDEDSSTKNDQSTSEQTSLTNAQRRELAQQQLQKRVRTQQKKDRQKQILVGLGSVLAVVLLVFGGTLLYKNVTKESEKPPSPEGLNQTEPLPEGRKTAFPPTIDCTYTATTGASNPVPKKVNLSNGKNVSTTNDQKRVLLQTNKGSINLSLNETLSPCTVNNFLSLVKQKYYNGTSCHRLTTGNNFKLLQCGDPTTNPAQAGTGTPGYGFANEWPTDQYSPEEAQTKIAVYPRGVIAMAHSEQPNSNGAQFFLVYGNSEIPPNYTIFGTIDDTGITILEDVAQAGINPPAEGATPSDTDGTPKEKVTIEQALVE